MKVAALIGFLLLPFGGIGEVAERMQRISQDSYGMLGVLIFCGLFALSASALMVGPFLSSFFARLLLAIFFVPSTLATTIYQSIADKPITYNHIANWWSERGLASSALVTYWDAMPYALLILCLGLLAFLLPPSLTGSRRDLHRRSSFPPLLARLASYAVAFGAILVLCAVNMLRAGEGLDGLPVHYRGSVMFTSLMINKVLIERQRGATAVMIGRIDSDQPRPNVLLVINESLRGDFLDINQDRGITPYLTSMQHRVSNFGFASSIANCSRHTHQGLRVGLNPENPVGGQQSNPFIWQYAKAAGYKTILIEGQVEPGEWNNNIGIHEQKLLDEWHYLNDPNEDEELWSRDRRLQKILDRVLGDADPAEPVFVYVVQYGMHFPHEYAYPESATRFPIDESLAPRTRAVNAYKNAVGWLVDPFFEAMLGEDRRFPNTVMIYTSDHGQDLMDHRDAVIHCAVIDPSPYEGLVPLLTLTDHPDWRPRLEAAAALNRDQASHFNIVPTVLEIFGFDPSGIREVHGRSLFDEIDEPQRFLSRGINITVPSAGLRSKLIWNELPEGLSSRPKHARPEGVRSGATESSNL